MNNIKLNHNEKLVILGNGPSLKGFDFRKLDHVDTLGMNAAYRYWKKIDWYPTLYSCLDDQLIETHANAIYELIYSQKIKFAFLSAKILDYFPNLISLNNVFFLESFNRIRQKRVANKGVIYIDSIPFKESNPSMVTTGAYSVRFGAHLGYSQIAILGIDLRYVEIIPGAVSNGGIKLILTETPTSNPNYFFDEYQQAGDKYNIPNPDSHGCNLHISAFESLVNDVVQFSWSTKIVNSNKQSVLYDKAILPYQNIKEFTSKRKFSALVIPTTYKELDYIDYNLKIWDQPTLSPSINKHINDKPDLVFVFSSPEDKFISQRVLKFVNDTQYVKNFFDKIHVLFIGLNKEIDYYEKDYTKQISGRGYKSGPNEQFFETIQLLKHYEGFIFYMENDCMPLRQGWLDEVRSLAEKDDTSWVIGSYYRGKETISQRFALHLNGNALYRVGDADFVEFAQQTWRKQLNIIINNTDKRMAYDCLPSYLFSAANPSLQNIEWKLLQNFGHRFRSTSLIQNISGATDNNNPISIATDILLNSPHTYIVHGRLFQKFLYDMYDQYLNNQKYTFFWSNLIDLYSIQYITNSVTYSSNDNVDFPRLLLIDSTPIGQNSATGQLKQIMLGNWPCTNFLQIWDTGGNASSLRLIRLNQSIENSRADIYSFEQILQIVRDFNPSVIYFRPIDSSILFEISEQIVTSNSTPLAIHIMDDWPERLRISDYRKYLRLNDSLCKMLSKASLRLSICQDMSDAYHERYGGKWLPLANGVNLDEFPSKDWTNRPPISRDNPFILRYMGGLADDMSYSSVQDIAFAVSTLHKSIPICFEIYTMNWYFSKAKDNLGTLPGVSIHHLVSDENYKKYLSQADSLVIAYNFDKTSVLYTRLSFANKLPECLASGSVIFAYGPREVATIKYLKNTDFALVVDIHDQSALISSITMLINDPRLCQRLGNNGRNHASEFFSQKTVQDKFRQYLSLIQATETQSRPLLSETTPKLHEDNTNLANRSVNFYNTIYDFKINKVDQINTNYNHSATQTNSPHYSELDLSQPITASQHILTKHRSITVHTLSNIFQISHNKWHIPSVSKQIFWFAALNTSKSTKNRTFSAYIRLMSNYETKLDISIERRGDTPYEGNTQSVNLTPNRITSSLLNHHFSLDHAEIILQLSTSETCVVNNITLTIDCFGLSETLLSISNRIGTDSLNLRTANSLFRKGDLFSALGIYTWLFQCNSLSIYANNAILIARRTGMYMMNNMNDLIKLLLFCNSNSSSIKTQLSGLADHPSTFQTSET